MHPTRLRRAIRFLAIALMAAAVYSIGVGSIALERNKQVPQTASPEASRLYLPVISRPLPDTPTPTATRTPGPTATPTATRVPGVITLDLKRPKVQEVVSNDLLVALTITSLWELQGVTARVGTHEVALEFSEYCPMDYCYPAWVGTLSLVGLEWGSHTVTVVATDVFGLSSQVQRTFVYDQRPGLVISAPLEGTVARPQIHVQASCTDDDPSGCRLTTAHVGDRLLASGTSTIDAMVSLAEFEGQTVTVGFSAVDSRGQNTRVERRVYVESSDNLVEEEALDGTIWDVRADRVLYLAQRGEVQELRILDRVSRQETIVMGESGKKPLYGYLTPTGAIFVEQSGSSLTNLLYEWHDEGLANYGMLNSALSLVVAGNWAVWNHGTTLVLRDLAAGSSITVTESAGNCRNDVAASGDVAYWGMDYRVYLLRAGVTSAIPGADGLWDTYPKTDGLNIVFRRSTPCCADQTYSLVLSGPSGQEILTAPSAIQPFPGPDYQVSNGWTAYTETGAGGTAQVWSRSPTGVRIQVSHFGVRSRIDSLSAEGSVTFLANARYVSSPPYDSWSRVGSTLGRGFWQDGTLYVILGGYLFRYAP